MPPSLTVKERMVSDEYTNQVENTKLNSRMLVNRSESGMKRYYTNEMQKYKKCKKCKNTKKCKRERIQE